MSKIIEHLYLGSIDEAYDQKWVNENNVKVIISFVHYGPEIKHNNVAYYHFPMLDYTKDVDPFLYYDQFKQVLDENLSAQQSVLVHCIRGASRSATNVIAYLMEKENRKLDDVLSQVKTIRPIVEPNKLFMKYLRAQEECLFE